MDYSLPPRPPADEYKIIGNVMSKDKNASTSAIPIIRRNKNSYTGIDGRDLPKTDYYETLTGGKRKSRRRRKSKSGNNRRKTNHRRKKTNFHR